jgi:hypothetical protein
MLSELHPGHKYKNSMPHSKKFDAVEQVSAKPDGAV